MSNAPQRIADRLIAWRWPLLAIGVAMAVWAYFPSRGLKFDRSIENMFAERDPLLNPYRQLKGTFGGNEIVVAAYVDEQLLTPAGIGRVDELTKELKNVAGVGSVVSLTTTPLGKRIIDDTQLARGFRELFENYTIGQDGQTAAVVCLLSEENDSDARDATIENLRKVVKRRQPDGVLAGEPVMVVDGFAAIKNDGRRLGQVSTVLLMLTIILCFRSLRWVIVPLAVVNFTLLATEATLVKSGIRLSMVSSMLWAIVTVVGIATVIHVVVHFRTAREGGQTPRQALAATLAVLGVPIIWTCFTDAAGFGSLLAAKVGPVQDFGVMMSTGALLAIASLALLLPGLALAGRIDADPRRAWGEAGLGAGLRRVLDWVMRRPAMVGLTSAVVVAAAAVGCFRLEVETDFTKNFRQSSSIVRAYDLVEANLRGAGVWDILLPAPAELDHDFLQRLSKLHERLEQDEVTRSGLTKTISLQKMIAQIPDDPRQWGPLLPAGASLTDLTDVVPKELMIKVAFGQLKDEELTGVKIRAVKRFMPDVYEALHNQSGRHYTRIMLRARERQSSHEKHRLIERVTRISREVFPEVKEDKQQKQEYQPPAQVTGYFVLLANLIDSMIRDQWTTFGIAAAAIWVMMLLAFRSLVLASVGIVPNLLPILLITGLMGWSGLKINMGAAMIAAVSVGLAVDSSIHYISAFRLARRAGLGLAEALHDVQQSVGRAVSFSTLALIVGFSALCFSEFVPIIYFGVLVSLAMLGGMAGNLVVLPALLCLTAKLTGEASPAVQSPPKMAADETAQASNPASSTSPQE